MRELVFQRGEQAGLANAWLAGDERKPPLAGPRAPPGADEQGKLLLATNKVQFRGCEDRLRAAGRQGSKNLPNLGRRRAVLAREREALKLEEFFGLAACVAGNERLSGPGERAEAPGLIGRPAKNLAAAIGDDEPGGDPDARPAFALRQAPDERERRTERLLGGVLLRERIAEIREELAPTIFCDDAAIACQHGRRVASERADERAEVLGIARQAPVLLSDELGGERDDLPPLRRSRLGVRRRRRFARRLSAGRRGFADRDGELVAAAGRRDDEARAFRVGLDLAAQAHDLHVDASVVGFSVSPGDKLEQLIARQCPSRALGESPQEAELGARERNLPAAGGH